MPESWSQSLVRSSLTRSLVDEAVAEAGGALAHDVEVVLRSDVNCRSQVADLKKAISSLKRMISPATFESLMEELEEIREDFTWAKSRRGEYVKEIQNWCQSFHHEMRSINEFGALHVGGHDSLEVVYVVGKAESEEVLKSFVEFLSSKKPPRKIMTNVVITASSK